MIIVTKHESFPDLSEYYAGKYDDLLVKDYASQYDSELESLWGFFSRVDDNYYTIYLGMNSLATDGRDIISGQIEYFGVWSAVGPFEDTEEWDNGQIALVEAKGIELNITDFFSSFDAEIDFDLLADAITSKPFTFNGSSVDDDIEGSPGDDTLHGNAGNDELEGSAGNDTLNGGAGNDILNGGAGDDTLDGAGGYDHVWYGRSNAAVSVDLASGVVTGGEGNDQLASIESVTGSNFADTLLGSDGKDWFSPDALGDQWTPNFNIGGVFVVKIFGTISYLNAASI